MSLWNALECTWQLLNLFWPKKPVLHLLRRQRQKTHDGVVTKMFPVSHCNFAIYGMAQCGISEEVTTLSCSVSGMWTASLSHVKIRGGLRGWQEHRHRVLWSMEKTTICRATNTQLLWCDISSMRYKQEHSGCLMSKIDSTRFHHIASGVKHCYSGNCNISALVVLKSLAKYSAFPFSHHESHDKVSTRKLF